MRPASRPRMMVAMGMGMRSCIARVTVRIVMRVLSAIGSRIVPMMLCMLNRRAIQPSSFLLKRQKGENGGEIF